MCNKIQKIFRKKVWTSCTCSLLHAQLQFSNTIQHGSCTDQCCMDMEILQSWSNPKLSSTPYPIHIRKYKIMDSDIQIRNRSINCTLANIIGIVYCASRGKNCGYFASCQTKVVEVVTWQVCYDTQKTRAKVWDWGVSFSLQFTRCRQEQVPLKAWPHWNDDSTRPLNWSVTDMVN